MERRAFFRAGLAAGAVGLGGVRSTARLARPPVRPPAPLRLDANENPLGLAPAARRAVIDGLAEANRYPKTALPDLVAAIARRHDATPEQVVLGNGSTEILRIAVSATAGPGGRVVLADPTFEDVSRYAAPFPFHLERVPLTAAYEHDVVRMRDRAYALDGPVLVYLCNPNNPTGTITDCGGIDEWIGGAPEHVFFAVDEAYFELVDHPRYWTATRWVRERPNVLVVRTFSKIFAMAGMRVGYGIAHPDTAATLRQFATRNTPNHLAQVAALASLEDDAMIERSRETNSRARRVLTDVLDELGIQYLPSQTNFLMHRVPGDVSTYIARMRERNVWVGRPFPPMLEFNRVSIGLPEEMERFADVLRTFRRQGWV